MIRTLTAALVVALAAVPAQSGQTDPQIGFCGRLAADLGMKPVKPVGGKPAYEVRALKGLGVALFGGSTAVSMMLKPPEQGEMGDPRRFQDACNAIPNGAACAVSGPALFEMNVGARTAKAEVRAGEKAEVRMLKNRVRCEER